MKVLAIIPARCGSKCIPRKNLRVVAGVPLIGWSIAAATAVGDLLHRVIVSTDDQEIADVSRSLGAEVPFLRPAELSGDEAATLPVLQHALQFVEEEEHMQMDAVLLLQPTSPLRTPDDIRNALKIMSDREPDSVVSIVEAVHAHPMLLKTIRDGRIEPYDKNFPEGARRQDLSPEVFTTNGAIYVARRDVIVKDNRLLGDVTLPYVMPPERSLDIDTEYDLRIANMTLSDQVAD